MINLLIAISILLLSNTKCCQAEVYSGELRDYFLERHNSDRRTKTKTPASNMRELTWSDEVAQIASKHSATCVFRHSRGNNLGENIAAFSVGSDDKATIDLFMKWWVDDELTGVVGNGKGIYSHASQVLWAESSKLGCGFTKCGGSLGIFVVCNFNPRGNNHINGWYLEGKACSKCPVDAPRCNDKLCTADSSQPTITVEAPITESQTPTTITPKPTTAIPAQHTNPTTDTPKTPTPTLQTTSTAPKLSMTFSAESSRSTTDTPIMTTPSPKPSTFKPSSETIHTSGTQESSKTNAFEDSTNEGTIPITPKPSNAAVAKASKSMGDSTKSSHCT